MLSSNHTFHMFALPGVKISNIIIELASYKGKLWELFFSLILMNIPLPYSQKQKFWNLLILSNWRTVFLLINLYQVLCTLYSPKCIYLRMITTITTLDLHQMFFNNTSIYGTKSFETSTISSWNFFQSHFTGINLKETSVNQIKHLIKNYFLNLYDNSVT